MARNLAIQKSSGEYIAPIDADDIWVHQKLEKQVQSMLEAEPSVGLVYACGQCLLMNRAYLLENIIIPLTKERFTKICCIAT